MKYPKILKDISKNVPLWPPSLAEGTCVSHTFFSSPSENYAVGTTAIRFAVYVVLVFSFCLSVPFAFSFSSLLQVIDTLD